MISMISMISMIKDRYGLEVSAIKPMSVGVGGDTYRIITVQGDYIFKIMEANAMNHPAAEPALCRYLLDRGIPVSEFVINRDGEWITTIDGRVSHIQKYINGHTFSMNSAPDWFMAESPKLLDRIHAVIDWTSACVDPVIWEITRSFFYADPSCRNGSYDKTRFAEYVSSYSALAPLNDYDRANILKLYYYQLAVCDYYAQYLEAPEDKKEEYLQQARFVTSVLMNTEWE